MQTRRPQVVVTFASPDRSLKDRFMKHFAVLEHARLIDVFCADQVAPGEDLHRRVEEAISRAHAVVLLLSPDFLASGFVSHAELGTLVERRALDGLLLIPVLIRSCLWQLHPWLSPLVTLPSDGVPLAALEGDARDQALARIIKDIARVLDCLPESFATATLPKPRRRRASAPSAAQRTASTLSPAPPSGDALRPVLPPHPPDLPPLPPEYRLLRVLRRGIRGTVVMATKGADALPVVLRIVDTRLFGEDRYDLRRLQWSLYGISKVCHPNVVRIWDFGDFEGGLFLTMDFLHGDTLETLLHLGTRIHVARAVKLMRHTLLGLHALHTEGVVLEGLSPSDIMVSISEHGVEVPVLFDFAVPQQWLLIRQSNRTMPIFATPYGAPESYRLVRGDIRSDLYSCGMILRRMVNPSLSPEMLMVYSMRGAGDANEVAQRDSIPFHLARTIARATAFCLDERFRNAMEFHDALQLDERELLR